MTKRNHQHHSKTTVILVVMLLFTSMTRVWGQNIRFGIFADPVIGWFSSDTKETRNDGARAGFNFGFTFNKYFAENYSFSTGISILNAGGRIYNTDTITMVFNNFNTEVLPNRPVVYHIQYLAIPLGLKFESNQIGYTRFFVDLGLDPKFVIGGKVDIPSRDIDGETAMNELRRLNMSYHILAGAAYSLGGSTELVFGLGFEHNFFDVTADKLQQPKDRITHNLLKFRLGVNF
ncbi:MAG: porin family protein [Bacteroidales bacterium]